MNVLTVCRDKYAGLLDTCIVPYHYRTQTCISSSIQNLFIIMQRLEGGWTLS